MYSFAELKKPPSMKGSEHPNDVFYVSSWEQRVAQELCPLSVLWEDTNCKTLNIHGN